MILIAIITIIDLITVATRGFYMPKRFIARMVGLVTLLVASNCALAADAPTLHVGDRAPGLSVSKWLKGEPVTQFQPGKVYVVEFWATWRQPCIKSIPH